jgi:hypothetical protein
METQRSAPQVVVEARLPSHDSKLVMAPPESIAYYTAILAMSGSGKSLILGRYLEEVITTARCKRVVFDPNANFSRVNSIDKPRLRLRTPLQGDRFQDRSCQTDRALPRILRLGRRNHPCADNDINPTDFAFAAKIYPKKARPEASAGKRTGKGRKAKPTARKTKRGLT